MTRSRWSLRASKSDRLLGPAAGIDWAGPLAVGSLQAAESDRRLGTSNEGGA
jgi:hypothetical protein